MAIRPRVGDLTFSLERTGRGPALLFVHGFPFDRSMWQAQLRALHHGDLIAPDLRGLGHTELGAQPVTMATYASDLVALLDFCECEAAVLCGLSMGGYVALEMIRRHPDRVRALVLMDTKAEADSPEGKLARDEMAALAQREGMVPIFERMAPRLLAKGTATQHPEVVRHLRRMIMRAPVSGVIAALRAMRDRDDARAWLGEIDVPTLVVVGEEDQITPVEVARDVARGIAGAQLAVVPGAGHLAPMECPEPTTRLLAEFLGRLDSTRVGDS